MDAADAADVGQRTGSTTRAAVTLDRGAKTYGRGRHATHALRGVDLALPAGSFTAVMGPSGSGKSTLLQCAAGLDRPSAGQVRLGDTDLGGLRDARLARLRRDRIGFVFQAFNLLPTLSARQNIVLPLRLAGRRADRAWFDEVVTRTGLADRLRHRPAELSGGQQQRVAIARALVVRPDIVFADEPTGALDLASGREILTLLREAVDTWARTLVMVTHDPVAASYADRVLFLADGRIVDDLTAPTADRVASRMTRLTTPTRGPRTADRPGTAGGPEPIGGSGPTGGPGPLRGPGPTHGLGSTGGRGPTGGSGPASGPGVAGGGSAAWTEG